MKTSRRNFLLSATSQIAIVAILPSTLSNAFAASGDVSVQDSAGVWDLKSLPHMLATAFFQEDVPEGPVSMHKGRGILPLEASQPIQTLQPEKTSNDGIVFSGNENVHLRFPNVKDSLRLYRWCLTITRAKNAGDTDSVAQVLSVNDGPSAQNCHPKIAIQGAATKATVATVWHGATESGTVKASLKATGFILDGSAWNVSLTYRRNGRLFASVNGVDSGYVNEIINWAWPMPDGGPESIIGGKRSPEMEWAYDCIVFGQGELSERMVQKIEGWAAWRVKRQADLPGDHPYRLSPPTIDEEDSGPTYKLDLEAWQNWGDGLRPGQTSARMGAPARLTPDFQRVFYEDFRRTGIASSAVAPRSTPTWFAPGWNSAVGASAQVIPPTKKLNLYQQTAEPDGAGLKLSLRNQKKWFAPAIYTVNDAGQGHSWEGEAIFRLRCRFSEYSEVPGGLFPAFWCYSLEPLFARELERIEIDFWEFDGKNPLYLNGASSHVHSAAYPGLLGHLRKDAKRYKVWGGELRAARLGTEEDFTVWDGKWHTWEFATGSDFTSLSVSLEKNGEEQMIELYRCPTPKEYLQRRYLIIDYALRLEDGEPDRAVSHDFEIDFVEVLQRAQKLEAFEKPFLALPTIDGVRSAGQALTCKANLPPELRDVWYYWYVDGYPRSISPSATFTLEDQDLGKDVRCMVKAVGAFGQPEAWSRSARVE